MIKLRIDPAALAPAGGVTTSRLPGLAVEPESRLAPLWRGVRRHPIWIVLLAEIVFFSLISRYFLTVNNLSNVLLQGAFIGFVSIGLTIVMISGEIDLTVGSVIGLCGCLSVGLQTLGLWPAILLSLAAGVGLGAMNGVIVEKTGINSFIVTLAGTIGIRGLAFLYTGGDSLSALSDDFNDIGGMTVGPVSVVAILFLVILGGMQWVLTRTTHGQAAYAIGGNRSAAINAGIQVARHNIVNFALSGLFAAVCGIAMAAQLDGATPILGQGYELWAIIAVVVGGTKLQGGAGSMLGTLGGVLTLAVLRNGMDLAHVEPFYAFVVTGVTLIAALWLDKYLRS